MGHVYVNKVGDAILAGTLKMGGVDPCNNRSTHVTYSRLLARCEIETSRQMPPLRGSDLLTCVHAALSFLWPISSNSLGHQGEGN